MTMTKPEMEVVRFNESDVIVASGEDFYTLSGFGDTTADNGKINAHSVKEFQDILGGMGQHTYFQYQQNEKVRATDLRSQEDSGLLKDGIYVDSGVIEGTAERLWWCSGQ